MAIPRSSTVEAPQTAEKGDMTSWEFLLQKEGDRTWLPLEKLTVEILEGRYRVVARTPHPNEKIDIYVSYVSNADNPPKRRVQQRTGQSNGEGLLPILPFTPFRTGRWELRCRPHVEAVDPAQGWHSQIQLQVLDQTRTEDEDLFGWDMSSGSNPEAADPVPQPTDSASSESVAQINSTPESGKTTAAAHSQNTESPEASYLEDDSPEPAQQPTMPDRSVTSDAELQQLANEMSQMVMDSVMGVEQESPLQDHARTEPAIAAPAKPSNQPLDSGSSESSTLQLNNQQSPFAIALTNNLLVMDAGLTNRSSSTGNLPAVGSPGRSVTIVGDIIDVGQTTDITATSPSPSELILTLELRDPSSKEIWASARESFPSGPLPLAFSQQLNLPEACRSQLLLGNATLWYIDASDNFTQLTSSDFNVMVPVGELLNQAQSDQATPPALQQAAPTEAKPSNTVKTLQQQAANNFLVSKFGKTPQPTKGSTRINTELLSLLKPADQQQLGQQQPAVPEQPSRSASSAPGNRPSLSLPKFGNPPPSAMKPADPSGLGLSTADDDDELCAATTTVEMEAIYSGDDPIGALSKELDANTNADSPELSPLDDFLSDSDISDDSDRPEEELSPEDNPFALPSDSNLMDLDEALGSSLATAQDPLTEELRTMPSLDGQHNPASLSPASSSQAPVSFELATTTSQDGGISLNTFPSDLANSNTDEVVVDDELDSLPKQDWMKAPLPNPEEIDPNLVVPLPEFTIPNKPLVQGETVRIQVRVAPQPGRLCVRLWMLDCQSRSLLGEPQWITAFLPLNEDWLEANVDIVIPDGSIELQFEAIAIEPTSQRESLKISTRRPILLKTEPDPPETW